MFGVFEASGWAVSVFMCFGVCAVGESVVGCAISAAASFLASHNGIFSRVLIFSALWISMYFGRVLTVLEKSLKFSGP